MFPSHSKETVPSPFKIITVPSIEPNYYRWTSSVKDREWQRPALAGETVWASKPQEYCQLYVYASLSISTNIRQAEFSDVAKKSWIRLRFENPQIGVVAEIGNEGHVSLHARAPTDSAEASQWCEKTLIFENVQGDNVFKVLRATLVQHQADKEREPAWLLLDTVVDNDNLVRRVDLILNADHQITDGIGCRILLSKYLSLLATTMTAPADSKDQILDWNKSLKNLPRPWISLMNSEQITSGLEYQHAASQNHNILHATKNPHFGLPLLHPKGSEHQNHHSIMFTDTESLLLMKAIKLSLEPGTNITHLTHASLILTTLLHSPLPPLSEVQPIDTVCWLNGRRYLDDPDANKQYIPICQSFAPIKFPELRGLEIDTSTERELVREKLSVICEMARKQYGLLRERKIVMPESVFVLEEVGRMAARNNLDTDLAPPQQERSLRADPLFLSDGITENYISHSYPQTQSPKAFDVEEVVFAASTDGPNLIVRLSSWRSKICLSGEWNGRDYKTEAIVKFLEDIKRIMECITDDKEVTNQ